MHVLCPHDFPCRKKILNYFNSTLAPAASSFFLTSSASFLATPAFTSFGAASTKSFASFKPNPVNALTSLITLIFLSPVAARKTVNSDFSSASGTAAPPAGTAATGAAADTPHFYSYCFERSAASTTVNFDNSSIILFKSAIF